MAAPSVIRKNINTSLIILREWPLAVHRFGMHLEIHPSSRQCTDTIQKLFNIIIIWILILTGILIIICANVFVIFVTQG